MREMFAHLQHDLALAGVRQSLVERSESLPSEEEFGNNNGAYKGLVRKSCRGSVGNPILRLIKWSAKSFHDDTELLPSPTLFSQNLLLDDDGFLKRIVEKMIVLFVVYDLERPLRTRQGHRQRLFELEKQLEE